MYLCSDFNNESSDGLKKKSFNGQFGVQASNYLNLIIRFVLLKLYTSKGLFKNTL